MGEFRVSGSEFLVKNISAATQSCAGRILRSCQTAGHFVKFSAPQNAPDVYIIRVSMRMNSIRLALAAAFFFQIASLFAADITPPTVLNVVPAAGSTVSNLTQVTIIFSEAVSGPEAEDLLIN